MREHAPWPLRKLLETNRNAVTVFGVLLHLAEGRRRFGATRRRIRNVCGLSERVIGAAINTLHEAEWITRTYASDTHNGRRSWFRIVLRNRSRNLWYEKRHTGHESTRRKTTHRKDVSCGTKNVPQPHKGLKGGPTAPALAGAGAARSAPLPEPLPEHPSARIERERLAEIRAAREVGERQAQRQAPEPGRTK
jgi:hypothetical protein